MRWISLSQLTLFMETITVIRSVIFVWILNSDCWMLNGYHRLFTCMHLVRLWQGDGTVNGIMGRIHVTLFFRRDDAFFWGLPKTLVCPTVSCPSFDSWYFPPYSSQIEDNLNYLGCPPCPFSGQNGNHWTVGQNPDGLRGSSICPASWK